MSAQIKPSVTNPTIGDVFQNINTGNLILKPDFQRRFVWTHDHQEEFLETILNGLPFPEIYVCEGSVDTTLLKTVKHVIDGQQRLTTIMNYIHGASDRPYSKIPPFANLTREAKEEFISYQIVIRDLGKIDDALIREIFRRINLTKFKLENVEIQNAVYDGKFIQTAKDILDEIGLEAFGVFRESEFSRMADLHFVLLVMSTLESGGYFAQDKDVEDMISKFNDEYPNSKIMHSRLITVFKTIEALRLDIDSMWFRKSNFFTLVVEMASNTIKADDLPLLKKKLEQLESNVFANKHVQDNEFGQYYSYMYQATHGRKARVVRSELFKKYAMT